jgi:hypothetical protein
MLTLMWRISKIQVRATFLLSTQTQCEQAQEAYAKKHAGSRFWNGANGAIQPHVVPVALVTCSGQQDGDGSPAWADVAV